MRTALTLLLTLYCSPVSAQYTHQEAEALCAEEFSEAQVLNCTHAQRISYGLFTDRQLKPLTRLHSSYRAAGAWQEASNLTHQMKEIVKRGGWRELEALITLLLWTPEDKTCFERDDWQYTEWRSGCPELRYYVADCYIMATRIAEAIEDHATAAILAERTAEITLGIEGEPIYLFTGEYNTIISPDYRADYWLNLSERYARSVEDKL